MKLLIRDLRWILPASLGLGLILSLLGPGIWWIGWLAYSLLLVLGLSALAVLWRSADAPRSLGWMLLLALILRLGLGMAFTYVLPSQGNDTPVENAGYIFRDAYNRDTQAWELASSPDPLWKAFDQSYSTDQYGGMLFLSASSYRLFSPDAHRPWLIILIGALAAAIGVALAWKAARKAWGQSASSGVGWIMALYPEVILLGGSQMREPFLITFIAMAFWGVVSLNDNRRRAIAWLAGAILGMLLFSPGVAVAAVLVLAVWYWLAGKERRIRWWAWIGVLLLVAIASGMFFYALRVSPSSDQGPLAGLFEWFRLSVHYDASVLELNSGWLQNVFSHLPDSLHMPFLVLYGIAQPVLPAAIADPAVWPMRILGIFRGLGWYALVPFLLYSLWAILKTTDKRERLAWLWLWLASWVWIILASARAGGDQWDNPRYRAIFLLFQAALAVQAFSWQRATRDRWLARVLAVEGVFLVVFGYWYAARYTDWRAGQVHVFLVIGIIVAVSILILVGGGLLDWRRAHKKNA
jgi:4-amino-4-deoxy-L-arabinose transferase-like glycosyltransferase